MAPISGTPEGHCLRLENWVGRTDGLHVRDGYTVVSSGLGSAVTALFVHKSQIFAATAMQVFNGSSALPGLNMAGGDWHAALLPNPGGLFLVTANGGDGLRVFDGATWQTITLDGIDTSTIVTLVVHQSRIFFAVRDSLTIYYLDVDCFAGTAQPVFLQPLVRKGGSVAALTSRTQDGGRNTNDQLVIVTTEGEMVIWSGTDPSTSQTWTNAGVFNVPRPVGRRCFVEHGGGLAYLSANGLLPLNDVLSKPDPEKPLRALSEPIWPLLNPSLASGAWSIVESIENEVTIINGPSGQFVLSATNAWSTFSGLNATCWLSVGGALYFGTSDGQVCRYGDGVYEDNGQPVSSYLVDRFDRIKTMGIKTVQAVRPLYTARHPYRPRVQMLANYREAPATFAARYTDGVNYQWEDITWSRQPALWNRAVSSRQGAWRSCAAEGHEFALMLGMKTRTPITYTGYDVQFEAGGSM